MMATSGQHQAAPGKNMPDAPSKGRTLPLVTANDITKAFEEIKKG